MCEKVVESTESLTPLAPPPDGGSVGQGLGLESDIGSSEGDWQLLRDWGRGGRWQREDKSDF